MELLSNSRRIYLLILPVILCLFGFQMRFISAIGITEICFLTIISYVHFYIKFKNSIYNYIIASIFAVIVWLFITHDVQGFANPIIFDRVRTSSISSYYSMRINFDKVIAALIIFSMYRNNNLNIRLSLDQVKTTSFISFLCISTILLPALYVGYVRFDPKIPDIAVLWSLNNLFCVCFSEEVVFRLYLQHKLSYLIKNSFVSILLASAIFGYYHYYMNSGIILAVLSAVCGMFYGYAFSRTNNNIVCSIVVHFLLNLVHLIFFTYPHFMKTP